MSRRMVCGIVLVMLIWTSMLVSPSFIVLADSIVELTQAFARSGGTPGTQRSPQLDFHIQVETTGVLQLQYYVRSTHCSSIRLYILVDGSEVLVTEWLGWPGHTEYGPLDTGLLDLGPVTPGSHTLTLSPEGRVSGCNTGWLLEWGGTARILVSRQDLVRELSVSTTLPSSLPLGEEAILEVVLQNTGTVPLEAGDYVVSMEFWDVYGRGGLDCASVSIHGELGIYSALLLGHPQSATYHIDSPLDPGDEVSASFPLVPPKGQSPSIVFADTLVLQASGPSVVSSKVEYEGVDINPSLRTLAVTAKDVFVHILAGKFTDFIVMGAAWEEAMLAAAEDEMSHVFDLLSEGDIRGAARHALRAYHRLNFMLPDLDEHVDDVTVYRLQVILDAIQRFWNAKVGISETAIWLMNFVKEAVEYGYDVVASPFLPPDVVDKGLILLTDPVNLFVVDPAGHRVGVDPTTGLAMNEIPGALMEGVHGVAEIIFIQDLLQGTYSVSCVGLSTGPYEIHIEVVLGSELVCDIVYETSIAQDAVYAFNIEVGDDVVTVRYDPVRELENFKEFVNSLPEDAFDNPELANRRKNALQRKIDEIILKVEAGDYTDAINKLFHDIRAKMDGDSTPADWIVDADMPSSLCVIIDHIISSIETLQQG